MAFVGSQGRVECSTKLHGRPETRPKHVPKASNRLLSVVTGVWQLVVPFWSGCEGAMKPEAEKVPVTLITGFLGAGKDFDASTVFLSVI